MSASLKPSFSIDARRSGTVSSKFVLMRMWPAGVVIRYEFSVPVPT